MNIQTSKIALLKIILNIENDKFIEKITEFIQNEKVDFWNELSLSEQKENPNYIDFWTIADVSTMLSRNPAAKKYFIKAVTAFNATDKSEQDMNIYKDIIKAQKACIKLLEKFTE